MTHENRIFRSRYTHSSLVCGPVSRWYRSTGCVQPWATTLCMSGAFVLTADVYSRYKLKPRAKRNSNGSAVMTGFHAPFHVQMPRVWGTVILSTPPRIHMERLGS